MDLNALESKLAAFGLEEDPPLAPAAPSANTLGHAPAPAAAPTDSAKKRKKKTTIKKRLRRSTGGAVSSPSANSSPGNRFTRLYEAGKKQLEKQKRVCFLHFDFESFLPPLEVKGTTCIQIVLSTPSPPPPFTFTFTATHAHILPGPEQQPVLVPLFTCLLFACILKNPLLTHLPTIQMSPPLNFHRTISHPMTMGPNR